MRIFFNFAFILYPEKEKVKIMKRRNFLLTALLSIPAITLAQTKKIIRGKRPQKAILVRADESRFFGEQKTVKDAIGRCVVSSADTEGDLLIVAPGAKTFAFKGGPPLHIHKFQDEVFYVGQGEFLVQVEDRVHTVKTGDTVFIPRGTPHTFANPIENNPGNLVSIHQPAGKTEDFFNYLATYGKMPDKDLDPDSPVVGPPIDLKKYGQNKT